MCFKDSVRKKERRAQKAGAKGTYHRKLVAPHTWN